MPMGIKMKKSNFKRVGILLLAAVLLCAALTGCNADKAGKKLENAVLSLFMFDLEPFNDQWAVYKKAEEMTGIQVKGTLSLSTSDRQTAYNIMLSSGNLADMIHVKSRTETYKAATDGVLVPLNGYIDKYAPNFKKLLAERPDVRKFITMPDGNIYYIPYIPDGPASLGWFIRQDWLDKLGLSAPKTLDEFYDVMVAFKNKDPNGNGQKDEVPYFNRAASVSTETAVNDLYAFWNVTKYFVLRDGKVQFGPLLPEFKEATRTIAKWYKEGLIDKEIYTRGTNAREYMLGNNIGGITHDWFASNASYNEKLQSQVPGINFVPLVPPAGYDGVVRELASRDQVSVLGWGVSAKCQEPETAMRWMDFWFSEKGRILMNFGIEGEDYDMIDGKPVFKPEVLNNELPVSVYLHNKGAQGNVGFRQNFDYERQWTTPLALKGIDEYVNGGYIQEKFPTLNIDSAMQDEYDFISKDVETYRDEMMQKWVLGSADVDATYDSFVAELRKMKVDRMLEILQTAYKKYMAQ